MNIDIIFTLQNCPHIGDNYSSHGFVRFFFPTKRGWGGGSSHISDLALTLPQSKNINI